MPTKMAPLSNELNESMYNTNNPYDQSKSLADSAPQFMTPNMGQLKGLDQMNPTPFQFYPNANRLRQFNNVGLPFMNDDAFNSMLKNYSSFPFQIPGNVPMDDKILEQAKVLNYLQQAGQTPLNRQTIFNFPPNDYQKMQAADSMRQGNPGVGGPEFHGNFMEDNHDELLPTMFKGDPRFDTGLPPGPLNNRRYNFDPYMNGLDEDFGEKTKKFKHN